MAKLLDSETIHKHLINLSGWKYANNKITKDFIFKDFVNAFEFMTKIAVICEQQNHHPDWSNSYSNLTISLKTHDVGGVSSNDIMLAQAVEEIAGNSK